MLRGDTMYVGWASLPCRVGYLGRLGYQLSPELPIFVLCSIVTTHSRVRRISGLSGPSGYSEYPMCTLGRWAAFPRCSRAALSPAADKRTGTTAMAAPGTPPAQSGERSLLLLTAVLRVPS